jgi:hypothetical protein
MKDRSMLLFTPIVLCLSAIWADSKDADVEIREKIVYSKAGDRELIFLRFWSFMVALGVRGIDNNCEPTPRSWLREELSVSLSIID